MSKLSAANLLGALTAVTGKTYEESNFLVGEGEEKTPMSDDEIKKLILTDYKAKHDGLDKVSEEKLEKAKQEGRKEVYGQIETKAAELGIKEMKWNEHGLSKVKEFFEAKIPNTPPTKDVTKTPEYLKVLGDLKDAQATIVKNEATYNQTRIFDKVTGDLTSILKSEDNKFVIPKSSQVFENNLNAASNALQSATYKGKTVKWVKDEDGKVKPRDEDNHPLYDDAGNEVTAKDVKMSVLKNHFDTNVAQPRATPRGRGNHQGVGGVGGTSKIITYQKGGEDKTVTLPSWKTKAEAFKWVQDNAMTVDKEVRDAAIAEIETISE